MRSLPWWFGLFLVACGSSVSQTESTASFQDSWSGSPNRPWPGARWHANRIQDWQIQDGRLECLTGQNGPAGRTAHLLTHGFGRNTWDAKLSVSFEPLNLGPLREGACAGFLFGMGAPETDWRATALVQQVPAAGGGILACVEASGHLSLRSFSEPLDKGGYWTVPSNVDFRNLPLLAQSEQTISPNSWPLRLQLRWTQENGLKLTATCREETVASLSLPQFPRKKLLGGISLFSARGAEKSQLGFGFHDFTLSGGQAHPERKTGPILGILYTTGRNGLGHTFLNMTVQHPVLGDQERPEVTLVFGNPPQRHAGNFSADGSFTTRFRLDPFPTLTESMPFHLEWEGKLVSEGIFRREPQKGEKVVLGMLSCVKNQVGPVQWNGDGLWFPHADLEMGVAAIDPDILYFAGDQIYEGDITGADRRSERTTLLDYHSKWQRFYWAFGDLTRVRPAIMVPDDHDVFHGNLWGAGGILARRVPGLTVQDSGGYKLAANLVNAIHGTQVSHLPTTVVSPEVGQGITTYSTEFSWGGLDFAVLSDRMWKDSPSVAQPGGKFRNGWPQAEGFHPHTRPEGASLLGAQQENFLAGWGKMKKPSAWMKVVLSQSPFAALHTLPASAKSDRVVPNMASLKPGEYPPDDKPVADADSNGWPQPARDRAVDLLAQAGALHLAGDQHLGSVAWYGKEKFRDGTVVFTGPAMANTFPRRWFPATPGANRRPEDPPYTGDFLDGFGNKITMLAVANPADHGRQPALLQNRAPGFGVVRFDPSSQTATLEAWPRWADPSDPSQQFPGWPIVVGADGRPKIQ